MSCANCGAQTPSEATQCPACGLPLAPALGSSWDAPPPGNQWGQSQGAGDPSWGSPPGGGPAGPGPTPWGAPPRAPYEPYPSGWDEPQPGQAGRLAGWWHRVGATLIDGIIIFVPGRIIEAAAGRGLYYAFVVVAAAAYTTFLLGSRGQTVGMMAVGTKCVREGTGTNLTYGPAFLRWLIGELLGVTIIGGLLDLLWPIWDANNQTLHDKVVHSLVIKVR